MDLGLSGRRAIVCGASAGLGRGVATSLAREGVVLTLAARGEERLNRTAREIVAETGATIITVACDVTTDDGREALLAAEPAPDILINNAGGPGSGPSAARAPHCHRPATPSADRCRRGPARRC